MRPLTEKARSVIDQLVKAFDTPESLVDTITRATLIPNNSPCVKWGPYNRFIVALRGTSDARGFRQWQESGRKVKKGGKAILILVPRFKKVENDDGEGEEEHQVLIGFVAAPVFTVEDTEGEPLPEYEPPELPRLRAVADSLGVSVNYTGAVSDRIFGVYSRDKGGEPGKITLYSHDLATFYHELAHALHHRTGKIRDSRQAADKRANEVVAEVAGAVLVNIFEGQEVGHQAISYIKGYSAKKKHLLQLLPEIVAVVDLAIRFADEPIPIQKGVGERCG